MIYTDRRGYVSVEEFRAMARRGEVSQLVQKRKPSENGQPRRNDPDRQRRIRVAAEAAEVARALRVVRAAEARAEARALLGKYSR